MKIETKYTIGNKVPIKVDGGDAMGEIRAIGYRLDREGNESINYELDAEWKYQGRVFTREVLRTEKELSAGVVRVQPSPITEKERLSL